MKDPLNFHEHSLLQTMFPLAVANNHWKVWKVGSSNAAQTHTAGWCQVLGAQSK